MQAGLKATLECLKSFSSTDFRGDLAAFKVPTLIIHGTEDKTVPIDASSRPRPRASSTARWSNTTARRMACLRPTSVVSPRT